MTFLPILGYFRKMCALDCGTISFMHETDSVMDKRLSFPLKRGGFESSIISFFFFFLFNLLVCSSLFLTLCSHGYVFFFNLAYVY